MAPYRSDLETAHARIASLEATLQRLEEDRARIERGLPPRTERPLPWRVIAVVAISCATLVGIVSLSPPSPQVRPLRRVDPSEPAPLAPAPPEPAQVQPPPPSAISPTLDAPPPPGVDAIGPMARGDSMFIGQYWEARVTHAGAHGPPIDTECLITMGPAAFHRAGNAMVRCGDTRLQAAIISPPERGEERGFCWFDGRDLYCAPPDPSVEVCWINTAGHVARCPGGIELYIHSRMRDPREYPPPDVL